MKRYYLIIISLLGVLGTGYSQYSPMLEEGSEWYHYFRFEASCNHHLQVSGDTIINQKTYKKLINLGDECNYSIESYYREDTITKQVFQHIPYSTTDTVEVLVFDYSHSVGDTLTVFVDLLTSYTLVIDSISSIIPVCGICEPTTETSLENPNVFHLRILDCPSCRPIVWVEGIGNLSDPFIPIAGWTGWPEPDNILLCHYNNEGSNDYHHPYSTEFSFCEGPMVEVVDLTNEQEIKIYPNPSKDMVTIQSESQLAQVLIYDAYGRLLMQNSSNITGIIDLSDIKAGLITLVITTVDRRRKIERVLKM